MERAALKAKIDELAKHLKGLSPLFDIPSNVDLSEDADFLYEVNCYFQLAAALSSAATLSYVLGSRGNALAERPNEKSKYARFSVEFEGHAYDLCHGTQIMDKHERKRAPDISLQDAEAGSSPFYHHVLCIWDAKHRRKLKRPRITEAEFCRFGFFIKWLDVSIPEAGEIIERLCPPAFRVPALVTNGTRPTETEPVMLEAGFSIVEGFEGNVDATPWPSPDQHRLAGSSSKAGVDVG